MTPFELRIAAETVWGEARGEPWLGKLAVAYVIRNRVEDPGKDWWGDDIIGVCTKPWQFTCQHPSDPNYAKLKAVADRDPVFLECRRAVAVAFAGSEPDPTHGATTYKVRGTKASWDAAVAHVEPVVIGRHAFWRLTTDGRVLAPVAGKIPLENVPT